MPRNNQQYPGLVGAEISPQDTSFLGSLREAWQRYTNPESPTEAGLETSVFTEPIADWASRQGMIGELVGSAIPRTRGDALVGAATSALPSASSARGPKVLQAAENAADDIIEVFRWGDKNLNPGNWVEAASTSKPLSYLLSTKWVPSVGGSKFAGYGSGASHAVRRGDLSGATGMGSFLADILGQRRYTPAAATP
jgi:hypothetical protein